MRHRVPHRRLPFDLLRRQLPDARLPQARGRERAATKTVVPDGVGAKLDAIATLVAELEEEVAPLRKCSDDSEMKFLASALITFGPAELRQAKEVAVRLHRVVARWTRRPRNWSRPRRTTRNPTGFRQLSSIATCGAPHSPCATHDAVVPTPMVLAP